jgi:hypothetical protein
VRWSQAWVRVLRITEVNVTLFLGCLSPEEMVLSTQVGWYAAAFSVAIVFASVLLSLNRGSFVWSLICVMLLVLHPAWTMGVDSGDCGYAKRFLSGALSFVLLALLMCQIFWPQFSRLRFLVILCALCWVASLPFVAPVVVPYIFYFSTMRGDSFFDKILQSFALSSHDLFRFAVVLSAICLAAWLSGQVQARRRKH